MSIGVLPDAVTKKFRSLVHRLGDAPDAPVSTVAGVPDDDRETLTDSSGRFRLPESVHRKIFEEVFRAEHPGEHVPASVRTGADQPPRLRLFDDLRAVVTVWAFDVFEPFHEFATFDTMTDCLQHVAETAPNFRNCLRCHQTNLAVRLKQNTGTIESPPFTLYLSIEKRDLLSALRLFSCYYFHRNNEQGHVQRHVLVERNAPLTDPLTDDLETLLRELCNETELLLRQIFFRRAGGWFG
jgi:hypothetical protein